MEAKFRIGEKVKIANHPDKSKIGKEVEIINLHHSNFNPQTSMILLCVIMEYSFYYPKRIM